MNGRLVRQLVGLYPPQRRTRFRQEFERFLEAYPSNPGTILNVIGWAIYERLNSLGIFKMDRRQQSLSLMLYAYLGAVAAGVNFYWTVDDTPLAAAIRNRPALFASWTLVIAGSLVALAAVAIVGVPVLLGMMRTAFSTRRWDIPYRLAGPPCTGLVLLAWMAAAAWFAGGHWVPTPWDVTGNWTAPPDWPPLPTRWALGSVTFMMMTAGLIVSANSVRQAIGRSDLSKHQRLCFTVPSMLLAGAVGLMAIGVLTWGWFVQQYAASDFHARNGGLFSSTNFASWAVSCIVFVVATAVAVQGARSALTPEAAQ
jgi:hypothetical protein